MNRHVRASDETPDETPVAAPVEAVEQRSSAGESGEPSRVTKPTVRYVVRTTVRKFFRDHCTDMAAALTYYSVLATFPALIAVLSLVGLFGQDQHSINTLLNIITDVFGSSVADTVRPRLEELSSASRAGLALVLGLAGALWSASGYVSAFGRAMNRIYGVAEGRPVWKLRPIMLLITVVLAVLATAVMLALVLSGSLARSVGDAIGVGSTVVTVWDIVKWPVILVVIMLIVAILYWATPNVRRPTFRWISVGAAVAIVTWVLLTVAFGFYVANFASFDKTYGSLAGAIVFLLWLWITNLALMFGAELDAELERGRQLLAGIPAEESIQLPPRDTRSIEKTERQKEADIRSGRRIRRSRGTQD